jgi:hypothetical protein
VHGGAASFAEIAAPGRQSERHARFLVPLAFVSPRIVASIADRCLTADLNVRKLVKLIDCSYCSWTEQERRLSGGA